MKSADALLTLTGTNAHSGRTKVMIPRPVIFDQARDGTYAGIMSELALSPRKAPAS